MYIDIDSVCRNITYLYCENVIVGVIEYWNACFHASKPKYILGFYLKKFSFGLVFIAFQITHGSESQRKKLHFLELKSNFEFVI